MSASPTWLIYAITCIICWGVSSAVVSSLSNRVSTSVIAVGYGSSLAIVNILYIIINQEVEKFYVLSQGTLAMSYLVYIILSIVGNVSNLIGYGLASPQSAGGIYTAVCSSYPVVTMIITYCFLGQTQIKLTMAIPGIGLIISGLVLLSFAKSGN